MSWLIAFLIIAFVIQGGLFIYTQRIKKKSKKDDVLIKYAINSRSQLFTAICRNDLPDEDMKKLNLIYTSNVEI